VRSGDIPLDSIDARYNVIIIAFAMPADTAMTMHFTPFGMSNEAFIRTVQRLQQQGKRLLLSIGGATCRIDITNEARKKQFVASLLQILKRYPFDGVDIDVEHGESIVNTGGTIAAPTNPAQKLLLTAIKEVMQGYRAHYQRKMLLTITPETAYVQGGQSKFGQIWGAYLPLLDALRDSLDMVQVQLYNSGSMYDINRVERFQGTPEFVVAMTEALIQGMNTKGGFFKGLPAYKVAVGLPACRSAAGGGYVDTAVLAACLRYLTGRGPQVGNYKLRQASGYPDLGGLMLWSINWEANRGCNGYYQMAEMVERGVKGVSGVEGVSGVGGVGGVEEVAEVVGVGGVKGVSGVGEVEGVAEEVGVVGVKEVEKGGGGVKEKSVVKKTSAVKKKRKWKQIYGHKRR
jgi:chitinase